MGWPSVRISFSSGMIDSGGSRMLIPWGASSSAPALAVEEPDRELRVSAAGTTVGGQALALTGPSSTVCRYDVGMPSSSGTTRSMKPENRSVARLSCTQTGVQRRS